MKNNEIVDSIAYCGLICALDFCYENCDGCKAGTGCGDSKCIQRECCIEKTLDGCWECDEFPCNRGYFSDDNESKGQFVGCVKYIKEVGLQEYADRVRRNQGKGIRYGMGGDYKHKSEAEVMNLLSDSATT